MRLQSLTKTPRHNDKSQVFWCICLVPKPSVAKHRKDRTVSDQQHHLLLQAPVLNLKPSFSNLAETPINSTRGPRSCHRSGRTTDPQKEDEAPSHTRVIGIELRRLASLPKEQGTSWRAAYCTEVLPRKATISATVVPWEHLQLLPPAEASSQSTGSRVSDANCERIRAGPSRAVRPPNDIARERSRWGWRLLRISHLQYVRDRRY
jgi:hypothetical protein